MDDLAQPTNVPPTNTDRRNNGDGVDTGGFRFWGFVDFQGELDCLIRERSEVVGRKF